MSSIDGFSDFRAAVLRLGERHRNLSSLYLVGQDYFRNGLDDILANLKYAGEQLTKMLIYIRTNTRVDIQSEEQMVVMSIAIVIETMRDLASKTRRDLTNGPLYFRDFPTLLNQLLDLSEKLSRESVRSDLSPEATALLTVAQTCDASSGSACEQAKTEARLAISASQAATAQASVDEQVRASEQARPDHLRTDEEKRIAALRGAPTFVSEERLRLQEEEAAREKFARLNAVILPGLPLDPKVLNFEDLTPDQIEAVLRKQNLPPAEIGLTTALFVQLTKAFHPPPFVTTVVPEPDLVNIGGASMSATDAVRAYRATRSPARLMVEPGTLPGEGMLIGRTYLFKVTSSDNENVAWTIASDGKTLASGEGRVFSFKPTVAGALSISVRSYFDTPFAFEDVINIQTPVSPMPGQLSLTPMYAFVGLMVFLVVAVGLTAQLMTRGHVGDFVRTLGKFKSG